MHIEPGLLAQTKILAANGVAAAVLASHAPALLRRPVLWLRTLLATVFFTLFMQMFHLQVGPSELHFVGAMPIYLTLGYLPTLFGFAAALSLLVPLLVLQATLHRRVQALTVARVLRLDAVYYAGVTLMVGFWLSMAQVATPFSDWLWFAGSYLSLVVLEPLFTLTVLTGLQRLNPPAWLRLCFDERLSRA